MVDICTMYMYPKPGVPPGGLSCHQLFRVCLGFVWGLVGGCLGFIWGFIRVFRVFTTVFMRFHFQGFLRVSCKI